jgi:hypothetical protein
VELCQPVAADAAPEKPLPATLSSKRGTASSCQCHTHTHAAPAAAQRNLADGNMPLQQQKPYCPALLSQSKLLKANLLCKSKLGTD